jgi:hypothetical protein
MRVTTIKTSDNCSYRQPGTARLRTAELVPVLAVPLWEHDVMDVTPTGSERFLFDPADGEYPPGE